MQPNLPSYGTHTLATLMQPIAGHVKCRVLGKRKEPAPGNCWLIIVEITSTKNRHYKRGSRIGLLSTRGLIPRGHGPFNCRGSCSTKYYTTPHEWNIDSLPAI